MFSSLYIIFFGKKIPFSHKNQLYEFCFVVIDTYLVVRLICWQNVKD